jgi:hypothetical protein
MGMNPVIGMPPLMNGVVGSIGRTVGCTVGGAAGPGTANGNIVSQATV